MKHTDVQSFIHDFESTKKEMENFEKVSALKDELNYYTMMLGYEQTKVTPMQTFGVMAYGVENIGSGESEINSGMTAYYEKQIERLTNEIEGVTHGE